jgi:hypothetical protein
MPFFFSLAKIRYCESFFATCMTTLFVRLFVAFAILFLFSQKVLPSYSSLLNLILLSGDILSRALSLSPLEDLSMTFSLFLCSLVSKTALEWYHLLQLHIYCFA